MIVATFWHATAQQAKRCVERETAARPEVNRVLQWNFGRMGVITRFYSVVSYVHPHQRLLPFTSRAADADYFADWYGDNKACLAFSR